MKELDISPDFTVEDIHKVREYNYEITRNMTKQQTLEYNNRSGRAVLKELQSRKAAGMYRGA